MVIDSGLILLLEAAHLGSKPWCDSHRVLYKEAYSLCNGNFPGNFIHLNSEDPASALILGWVLFHYTRQPRTLFVPEMIIQKYGELFKEIDHGNSIRPIEGRLNAENNARNWLGMVSLVYTGEPMTGPRLFSLIELLSWQLIQDARILLDGGERFFREIIQYESTYKEKLSTDIHGSCMIIRWHGFFEVNEAIPASIVHDFLQDDPVVAGISTLMSSNERFQLYFAVRSCLPMIARPIRFIEVGSFAGGAFYAICKALQRNKVPFQGIAVEPDGKARFHEVIKYFRDNAVHFSMNSHDAAPLLERLFADYALPEFILIDGDHSYEAVYSDIQDYYPLLAPGGIIMFHDYLPEYDEQNRDFILEREENCKFGISDACRNILEQKHGLLPIKIPLLFPTNPSQTLACKAIIPGVFSTIRAYRKPVT